MTKKLQLQPGDIWRHNSMGLLYVTDEKHSYSPDTLKCYWSMGGNPNAPYTIKHPNNTTNLTLVQRLGEQDENEEWRLKPKNGVTYSS